MVVQMYSEGTLIKNKSDQAPIKSINVKTTPPLHQFL